MGCSNCSRFGKTVKAFRQTASGHWLCHICFYDQKTFYDHKSKPKPLETKPTEVRNGNYPA